VADRRVEFLLIGGGVAAASCARELRAAGGADAGSILVVGREQDPPYERPPLSKSYLAGSSDRADALILPGDWWEANDVELLTRTSVMKIDPAERVARLSTKEEVSFGQALVATGANVRRLRVDGCDQDGIHYLRAFANADAIRADALAADRVVLIGGSYIACELAASLTALGVSCTMLMQEDVVLERVLGRVVGEWVHEQLSSRGVEIHGGDDLERFEGDGSRVGRVISRRGLDLECGCVAIGAGVAPDVMLARSAGLELGPLGGVLCDERLETSLSGVYAAGDMAEYASPLHPGGRARVEHFEVAAEHGRVAARNMLGGSESLEDLVPYFWSDLSDWATIEYVGLGVDAGTTATTLRGSLEDSSFTAFYSDELDGRLVGAATVGRPDDLDHARRLIRGRTAPPHDVLADEAADLASL
jgi:3-phenylpropionate/trans-cinnamate dioxygenase ferredoxin reductase subunit